MAEYNPTYWNELIDKYRNGTISKEERFQLEKEALDDPFLFDALEGFALYQEVNYNSEKERKPATLFTLSRIAVAASVVFLVAVIYNLSTNPSSSEADNSPIAMVLETDEEVTNETSDEAGKEDGDFEKGNANSIANEVDAKKATQELSTKNEKDKIPYKNIEEEPTPVTDKEKAIEAPKIPSSSSNQSEEISRRKDEVVVDIASRDGDDGVENVVISDLKQAIAEEAVPQNADGVADIANAAGLESRTMKEEEEIVPVSVGSEVKEEALRKRKGDTNSPFYHKAVPVIGKKIFDEYAKERIDKRGLRQAKPQEVTIEFRIDKNGNLSDFHHIFTGCSECGPFAISILQNSGEWETVPPGFSGRARYTFIF